MEMICICCLRPSKFECRYCNKTCCEWCYYGGSGEIGHKWRCDYHDGTCECVSKRCPDPLQCDHERPLDNEFGEGGLVARNAKMNRYWSSST